jgi:hypothetical protein
MPFPNAAGTVSYSGTFIPEIWSSKLIEKFYDATVLSAISNTNYEGEIKGQGDKVKIRTVPSLAINDYQSGQTLTNQRPESNIIELLIDKGKYWSAIVDDVQDTQSDIGLMNMWASDASEQMKIAIDTQVLGSITPDIAAANKGGAAGRISGSYNLGATGAPVQLSKTNVIDMIADLASVLDEQNVPESGRFVVLPHWVANLIKKSDLKDASISGDGTSIMRNGRLGMIDNFTLYKSNNIARVTDGANQVYDMVAGHKNGLTFASQLVKTETLRAESTFGNIMRGLQVFGYKVVDGSMLARAYIYK